MVTHSVRDETEQDDGTTSAQRAEQFDELVRTESSRLIAASAAIVGTRHLAEEVVQDAFVRLLRRGISESLDRPAAWLRTVVVNASIDVVRRARHERQLLVSIGDSPAGAGAATDPAEALPDTHLWAAVRALPEDQAKAVALRYAADQSTQEIADALSITTGAVNSLLFRARQGLRSVLSPDRSDADPLSPSRPNTEPTSGPAVDLRSRTEGLAKGDTHE
jgi:RNA polymerase sigma factor (sigma-70 family)